MQPLEFIKDSSLNELIEIQTAVEEEISLRQDTAKQDLIDEIREKASALGLTNAELSKAIQGVKTSKTPPKYRNPLNSKETWTGRGRKPKWLSVQLGEGRKLEEFII